MSLTPEARDEVAGMLRRALEAMLHSWCSERGTSFSEDVAAALATLPQAQEQPQREQAAEAEAPPRFARPGLPDCGCREDWHIDWHTKVCMDSVKPRNEPQQGEALETVAYNTSIGLIPATSIQAPHPSMAVSALVLRSAAETAIAAKDARIAELELSLAYAESDVAQTIRALGRDPEDESFAEHVAKDVTKEHKAAIADAKAAGRREAFEEAAKWASEYMGRYLRTDELARADGYIDGFRSCRAAIAEWCRERAKAS